MQVDFEFMTKYGKWLDKKAKGKPPAAQLLQRRTLNTAMAVVSTIRGIPFTALSHTLYFFCKDIETGDFARQYESQLELAGANEDLFVKGLHGFYNKMLKYIKEGNRYQEFFEFISACSRARYLAGTQSEAAKVIDSYQCLLLQQTEYIRPNKFDMSVVVCGRTTTGELMTIPDTFPYFDLPAIEIERWVRESHPACTAEEMERRMRDEYQRYGYDVSGYDDVEMITEADRIFTNHQCALLPYINEYTFDIVPDPANPFSSFALPLYTLHIRSGLRPEGLQEQLRHRAKTLPGNGSVFTFTPSNLLLGGGRNPYRALLLKEMIYDDAVIMLYRLDTESGQLCGYYHTKDGYLYSILQEAQDSSLYMRVQLLILYLYATQVTRGGQDMLARFNEHFGYEFSGVRDDGRGTQQLADVMVRAYRRGGRPEDLYHPPSLGKKTGPRAGSADYESEPRPIQGFVRKLGPGKTPSAEAVARASALGYDLAPDETFVQPFIRRVLRLKGI